MTTVITEARYELAAWGAAALRRARGGGPSIVLVHGAGGSDHSYDALVPRLAPPFDVLVPALPGRTGSAGPAREHASEVAAWLAALLAAAGVARPVVCGHSYGGAVAIEYALAHPAAALVLLATGARLRVHPGLIAQAREAAAHGAHMPLIEAAFGPASDAALRAEVEARHRVAPPEAHLADWIAVDRFDRMASLGAIAVPTLVIGGELDPLTPPKYQRYLAEHVAGAELVMLPGASHMLVDTHGELVAAAIRDFVARRVA